MMNAPKRKTSFSAEKRALFHLLLKEERVNIAQKQTIPRRADAYALPLSFAQERLWFLEQLVPGNIFYNIPVHVHMIGRLDANALKHSLSELVCRHEALRTTFITTAGSPVQVIAPSQPISLPIVNLSEVPEGEVREAEAQRLIREEAQRPFDLSKDILLRAILLRLGEMEHVLLLTMHHIASDGWSLEVCSRELATLYAAFSTSKPSPLPALPIQYADFVLWQRQWLQGAVLEKQLAHWRKQLSGIPTVLDLPTDRPRPAVPTLRGATTSFMLPKSLSKALQILSHQERVTLNMLLLAAFKTLLHRYTRQEDIVVGSPIAGRNRSETQGLIGLFVNMLVLRTDLSGNPSFRELLGRVREVTLGAYAYQELPFERLVVEVQPERDMSRTPLFQVVFALQNAPRQRLECAGLSMDFQEGDSGRAQFDLELEFSETPEGLYGLFKYSLDLFEATTIIRMVKHFQTLVESIVANPDQRLSDVPLLSAVERQQVLVEWNATQADFPQEHCIHQLFEAQAEHAPDAVALVCEDQSMTYRELNRRANQLAHRLRRLGVGPEVLVGICMERSLELIVGLLGILKAGGAYLPMDPAYPQERLTFMLEDSQVKALLTQERLRARMPEHEAQVVCLDADWETFAQENEANPASGVTVENLVYVIYTSGSTGRPKGVLITHRALVNHSVTFKDHFDLQAKDRILQFAPISFDVAAEEIFPSLLAGASIALGTDQVTDFLYFSHFLEKERLTVLNLPTSYWHLWVSQLSQSTASIPSSLRLVVVGSEKASPEQFATWRKWVGNSIRWANAYGPTEATITTTIYEPPIYGEDLEKCTLPIGRPIANMQVYVLDPSLQPVSVGVPGELYISGAGLARGYLNHPELTVERFIRHPFSNDPNARLYKTGDLVRYLPDGNIEFLGRIDHQVKIRGFRIELGEIETVLELHPAVREAVVVAREDAPGDKRLVAYVVQNPQYQNSDELKEGMPMLVSQLRSLLKEWLPDYMIPPSFVLLEVLPLTPNGKVDRQALPAPDYTHPELEERFVAPHTPLEEVVAASWSQVLGIERVSIHDDFFALGGHSLLATRVILRLRTILQVEVPLRSFFEAPTVAQLAKTIGQMQARDTTLHMPVLRMRSREAYRIPVSSMPPAEEGTGSRNQSGKG